MTPKKDGSANNDMGSSDRWMGNPLIFRTVVGSHLWESAGPDSDIDEFVCYLLPKWDILLGRVGKSYQTTTRLPFDNKERDLSVHEAGKVVQQLLKGNPNFLIGVLSNKVIYEAKSYFKMLRSALIPNISKNCYDAFVGYGTGHYLKCIESGKDTSPRRCNIGVRFFNFGISILMYGKPDFSPVIEATPEIVYNRFDMLKRAYEISPLPDEPEHPEYLEDWLIDLREEME